MTRLLEEENKRSAFNCRTPIEGLLLVSQWQGTMRSINLFLIETFYGRNGCMIVILESSSIKMFFWYSSFLAGVLVNDPRSSAINRSFDQNAIKMANNFNWNFINPRSEQCSLYIQISADFQFSKLVGFGKIIFGFYKNVFSEAKYDLVDFNFVMTLG